MKVSDLCLDTIIPSLFLLCVAVLTFLTYKRRWGLPPGPPCLPIVGTLGQAGISAKPGEFQRLRAKYGDVCTMMFALQPVIVVSGYETLRELVIKHADALSERPQRSQISVISKGHGIAGSSGELWKEHRSFALKTLRNFGFGKRSLEEQILEEVQVFLQEVNKTNQKPFDMRNLISVSISNIICSMIFGKRFEHDDENLQFILNLINQNFNLRTRFSLLVAILPWLRFLPGDLTGMKTRLERIQHMKTFFGKQIEEHRSSFDEDNIRDYIDAFLYEQAQNADKTDHSFTEEQLLWSIRDFFIAGSETTATTLRWAVLFLITNQNVQEKMRQEIDKVIGPFRRPSMADKQNLPYCEAFITETQRLGNIAPIAIPHGVKYDVTWNGYVIPEGATVLLNLESVGMDKDTFPEPQKFDPNRFLDESGKCVGQNKFVPFSLGRRICLGESLARMELFLFVVSLVQRFELYPEDDQSQPALQPHFGVTRSPQPFKFRAVPRE